MSKKAADTKERIVNTAANLFSSYGFAATSVDDIVTAAGITKGAFYHHFKTKEKLCENVLDLAVESYHRLAASVPLQSKNDEPLSLWFKRIVELQASGQWLYDRLLGQLSIEFSSLSADTQNKLKLFWDWCRGNYEALIRQASGTAPMSAEQTAALARLFMSAHFGSVWLDRCSPTHEGLSSLFESLLKLAFGQRQEET